MVLRFLLRLIPVFIIYTAANAQAAPVLPDVPNTFPGNSIDVPQPDTSFKSTLPGCQPPFSAPSGIGDLKEAPCDSAPDQTGSRPNKSAIDLNDNSKPLALVVAILIGDLLIGFVIGYSFRAAISRYHRSHSMHRRY
jgi:hypothetical protein